MLQSWIGYFVLSFFFENGSYLHIMTVFKGENKDKRISQDVTFIITSFLSALVNKKLIVAQDFETLTENAKKRSNVIKAVPFIKNLEIT